MAQIPDEEEPPESEVENEMGDTMTTFQKQEKQRINDIKSELYVYSESLEDPVNLFGKNLTIIRNTNGQWPGTLNGLS